MTKGLEPALVYFNNPCKQILLCFYFPLKTLDRKMIGKKAKVGLGVIIGLTLGLLLLCVFGMVGLSICCKRSNTLQGYGDTTVPPG